MMSVYLLAGKLTFAARLRRAGNLLAGFGASILFANVLVADVFLVIVASFLFSYAVITGGVLPGGGVVVLAGILLVVDVLLVAHILLLASLGLFLCTVLLLCLAKGGCGDSICISTRGDQHDGEKESEKKGDEHVPQLSKITFMRIAERESGSAYPTMAKQQIKNPPLGGSEGVERELEEVTDNLRTINVAVGCTRPLEETTAATTSVSRWISLLEPLCSTYWIISASWPKRVHS